MTPAAIKQAVHLGNDCGGLACFGVRFLAFDQRDNAVPQSQRRNQQRRVGVGLSLSRKIVEDPLRHLRDLWPRRQQADVGVKARGDRVVVAGAKMRVAADDAIRIAPHQQRQFAMRFVAKDAVEDADAGILQLTRPTNIRVFVEARHQFDHNRHILALSCLD